MITLSANKISERGYSIYNYLCDLNCNPNIIVAGGCIRSMLLREWPQDIDIFFKNKEAFEEFKRQSDQDNKVTYETENSVVYKEHKIDGKVVPLNLVKIAYYETPEKCIETFDFTISQFALDKDQNIIATEGAILDLYGKRLVIDKLTYPVSTIRRMIKFTKRGYYMCDGAIKSLFKDVVAKPELINVDVKYID